ncbi:MAG: AMP-binding protein [Thermoplasmata archaeon]|nr:MAG: AMP-binding protein [Thermoplasmata archaeon]
MLYDILAETAHAQPDKPAVICGQKQFTYAQLLDRVDRLANALKDIGIARSHRIAVIHRNCHRCLESYFAAAKLGAILVPLNYRLISKDYIYVINNCLVHTLICHPRYISWVYQNNLEVPLIENIILTESPDKQCPANERISDYETMLGKAFKRDMRNNDILESDIAQI